jgi:hypothetical protein
MNRSVYIIIAFSCPGIFVTAYPQIRPFSADSLKEDFAQFRNILEENHCCLYEYTSKTEMDSLFDAG